MSRRETTPPAEPQGPARRARGGAGGLWTSPPQTGEIRRVTAFLVSPRGLPMAAVWLVGKVQDLRYAIQDAVYG